MKLPVSPYTPKSSQQNRNKYQKIEETEVVTREQAENGELSSVLQTNAAEKL